MIRPWREWIRICQILDKRSEKNYIKLESELSVARQVNNKPKDYIVSLERQCCSSSQCSRQECLEISGIPNKTEQKELEDTTFNIFRKSVLMLILISQILRIVTGYRAKCPNVLLSNFQNENIQKRFVIARKNWKEWIWLHLRVLLQCLLRTALASITRCVLENAKNF